MKLSTSIDVCVMWGVARASVYLCCSAAVPIVRAVSLCSDAVSSKDVPLFCTTSFGSSNVKKLLRDAAEISPYIANFELNILFWQCKILQFQWQIALIMHRFEALQT